MKLKRTVIRFVAAMLTVVSLLGTTVLFASNSKADNNRFNVMFALDASGSMKDTDPDGLRFDAISQFTNLLAAYGNYLGGIVFSTDILLNQELVLVDSQQDREDFVKQMNSVEASGWTNTGEALLAAVENLLTNGDPNLPSVIVFLSDGNTKLGDKDETEASLSTKADAIQMARENNIEIYTVCLNADQSADISEMEQISAATGGVFQEVNHAKDLGNVFNTFYNLIYGTSTVTLVDEVFSESGVVEKKFDVPGIGVEEVNIIIYGTASSIMLFEPDGTRNFPTVTPLESLSMIKITDVKPGTWGIVTTGVPGDKIKINMVYNTNLGVNVYFQPNESVVAEDTEFRIIARLSNGSDDVSSVTNEQYEGFEAVLHVLDAYEDEISSTPMSNVGNRFEIVPALSEGTYKFRITVIGSYVSTNSEIFGPFTIVPANEPVEEKPVNTPPEPIENPVEKMVYIWPFISNSVEIDMATLAVDAEDDQLRYKVLSSSFIEGNDYSVDGDKLKIDHFSLSKGAFTIRATDSGGLSCDIEVIVKSRNVGIIALIAIGAAAVIVLAVSGILTYRSIGIPFMGMITVENIATGQENSMQKSRGRLRLSSMQVGQTQLPRKVYFQATGKKFIYVVSPKPLYSNNSFKASKKIRVESSMDVKISSTQTFEEGITVRFESLLNNMQL